VESGQQDEESMRRETQRGVGAEGKRWTFKRRVNQITRGKGEGVKTKEAKSRSGGEDRNGAFYFTRRFSQLRATKTQSKGFELKGQA
jgi:hypothetical protein